MKKTIITKQAMIDNLPALKKQFGSNDHIAYPFVSQSQFSISRYSGGCTINGKSFTYLPDDDMLVRDDVLKWLVKHLKTKETP
jgi:hypothetical protein